LTGGAQKVLELAGAVFRHKDDKKRQQDLLCYYFEVELGYKIQWPDTSNTRYHSHGDATCKYLVNDTLYLTFLELIPLKKKAGHPPISSIISTGVSHASKQSRR
jgi:hypothetical protein